MKEQETQVLGQGFTTSSLTLLSSLCLLKSGLTGQGPSLARAPRLTKAAVGLAGDKATSPYGRPWYQ